MTVAEAEELEQKKKEEAIEIAALAGMVVLSCINPVAGSSYSCLFTILTTN